MKQQSKGYWMAGIILACGFEMLIAFGDTTSRLFAYPFFVGISLFGLYIDIKSFRKLNRLWER